MATSGGTTDRKRYELEPPLLRYQAFDFDL
jgi:hypothetical protein